MKMWAETSGGFSYRTPKTSVQPMSVSLIAVIQTQTTPTSTFQKVCLIVLISFTAASFIVFASVSSVIKLPSLRNVHNIVRSNEFRVYRPLLHLFLTGPVYSPYSSGSQPIQKRIFKLIHVMSLLY